MSAQFTLSFMVILSSILGAIFSYWVVVYRNESRPNWSWKWVGAAAILVGLFNIIVVPWAFDNAVRSRADSKEFWHTSPKIHFVENITCDKTNEGSNPCQAVYRCDSYRCRCDSDGDCSTCYHDCPYCSYELRFIEEYSTGDKWAIDGNQLPDNPEQNRWQSTSHVWESEYKNPIPQQVINNVGVGTPPLWQTYSNQAQEGYFRPITLQKTYPNWFVAIDDRDAYLGNVDSEVVQQFTDSIPTFYRQPNPDGSIDFIYTVGFEFTDAERSEWNRWLNSILPPIGMELRGSLRVVVVEDNYALIHADEYATATQIKWSSPEQGENLLPKNSVVLMLFREAGGSTIAKARAFTGMPIGNEGLQKTENLEAILRGQAFDPILLFGGITTKRGDGEIYYDIAEEPGLVVQLLWGLQNPDTKFDRVSMEDSFGDLRDVAKPTFSQAFWIIFITSLVDLPVFFFELMVLAWISQIF